MDRAISIRRRSATSDARPAKRLRPDARTRRPDAARGDGPPQGEARRNHDLPASGGPAKPVAAQPLRARRGRPPPFRSASGRAAAGRDRRSRSASAPRAPRLNGSSPKSVQLDEDRHVVRRLFPASRRGIDLASLAAGRRLAATAADGRCASLGSSARRRPGSPRTCKRCGSSWQARKASVRPRLTSAWKCARVSGRNSASSIQAAGL